MNKAETGTFMGHTDRVITATYRPITEHKLTVKQLSGDKIYTQNEFSTLRITAEDAPPGKEFIGWSKTGEGELSSWKSQTTTFTFGNGDTELTPNYVNVWTITVVDGTIENKTSALLREGYTYDLKTKSLAIYEQFLGWTQVGPGTISNTAATYTRFTVGAGDTTITANLDLYPDKIGRAHV